MEKTNEYNNKMQNKNNSFKDAAVLVPIYLDQNEEPVLVLIRRSNWGVHGGQLAFPGGKTEYSDQTLLDTALRESEEEIGIKPDSVEILEHLPPVETHVTGFRIHPFLARINPPTTWQWDKLEIAEVLEVNVKSLIQPEMHGEEIMEKPEWRGPRKISFYQIGQYKLWGASYKIIHPLIPKISSNKWF